MSQSTPVQGVTVFGFDKTLSVTNSHNECEEAITLGIGSPLENIGLGPFIYDASHAIADNRKALLDHMRDKVKFHETTIKELVNAISSDQKIAIGSFTSHPDIAIELLAEHIIKNHSAITRSQINYRLKVVAGLPSEKDGGSKSPFGKMFHVIEALKAHGITPTPETIKASRLIDDSEQNIITAWKYGMSTEWLNDKGEVHQNILPVMYGNGIHHLQIQDDKSIDTKGLNQEELTALGEIVGRTNLKAGAIVKPSKSKEEIDTLIAWVALKHPRADFAVGTTPNNSPTHQARNTPQPYLPVLTSHIQQSHIPQIKQWGEEYLPTSNMEIRFRQNNYPKPMVATSALLNDTVNFIKQLEGFVDNSLLSRLDNGKKLLNQYLEANTTNPDYAKKDPAFNVSYAYFCGSSHQAVAEYHAKQKTFFQDMALTDRTNVNLWNECAANAGRLQEISTRDARINFDISMQWKQKLGVSQQAPSPDNARRLAHEMRDALGAQSTTTGRPMVVADPVQSAQSKAAKPKVVRSNSI